MDSTPSRGESRSRSKPVSTSHWFREKCDPIRASQTKFYPLNGSHFLLVESVPFWLVSLCHIKLKVQVIINTVLIPKMWISWCCYPQVSAMLCIVCLLWYLLTLHLCVPTCQGHWLSGQGYFLNPQQELVDSPIPQLGRGSHFTLSGSLSC